MFMPIGVPDPANATISKLVKSGLENTAFSYSEDQGSLAIKPSALATSVLNFAEISLSTMDTNP